MKQNSLAIAVLLALVTSVGDGTYAQGTNAQSTSATALKARCRR